MGFRLQLPASIHPPRLCRYDVIARFNGGANAGHTIVVGDQKFAFHLLPCGLIHPNKANVIGNGMDAFFKGMCEDCMIDCRRRAHRHVFLISHILVDRCCRSRAHHARGA